MISYSTNWMGPVSTKWYEDRNIPYVMEKSKGVEPFPVREYKDYLESYSCGRIDIRGLDEEDGYWCGQHEYGVASMRSEDWDALGDWLYDFKSEELVPYDLLIEQFETHYKKQIRWVNNES